MQLDDLYREVIVDHYNRPRNFGRPEKWDIMVEGKNPVCGDEIAIYLTVKDDIVSECHFDVVAIWRRRPPSDLWDRCKARGRIDGDATVGSYRAGPERQR